MENKDASKVEATDHWTESEFYALTGFLTHNLTSVSQSYKIPLAMHRSNQQ